MSGNGTRCLIVLSTKSAGSSALQNLLCASGRVHHVDWTRHNENETLYWVKAASVLGLPQTNMADSEVPVSARRARAELAVFFRRNLGHDVALDPDARRALIGGWEELCRRYSPVFLEKTPHHLHQRAALDLMLECRDALPDIPFHFVGLLRNPMDALYSMWNRRREIPEVHQFEWLDAYRNLMSLTAELGDDMTVVRYEDVIDDPSVLAPVCEFAGIPVPAAGYFHARSIAKWRDDPRFGFALDPVVADLAREYGYAREELANEPTRAWAAYRQFVRVPYRTVRPVKLLVRSLRKRARDTRSPSLSRTCRRA